MRILYLIDSKKNYHKRILPQFLEITGGEVIDMADPIPLSDMYFRIEEYRPDVVITFDLAGFELRTSSDTLSLNNIYARMAHILFGSSGNYGADIKARQNLSMFTYIPDGEDCSEFLRRNPLIANVACFKAFDRNAESDEEKEKNISSIRAWWSEFKTEAMLE